MDTVVVGAGRRGERGSPVMRRLRKDGKLPGNIYGKGIEGSIPVIFAHHEVSAIINRAAKHLVGEGKDPRKFLEFTVKLPDAEFKTRLREVQRDIITREFAHLEFITRED